MSECKVSICCLAYNHEKYIRQALDSMLNQETNFNYEIIVIEDCSTDGTRDIVREYMEKYPDKVRALFQKENQYSKEVAIVNTFFYPLARGEYITYCEGDDYWVNTHKLQKQVDFLDTHPEYVACTHGCWEVDQNGKKIVDYYYNDCYVEKYDLKVHTTQQLLSGQIATLMHRKSACEMPCEEALRDLGIIKITGDIYRTAILVVHGPIHRSYEDMTHHRRIYNTGDSWTARNARNKVDLHRFYFDALGELEEYMNKYFDPQLSYEQYKYRMAAASFYMMLVGREKKETFAHIMRSIRTYPMWMFGFTKMLFLVPFRNAKKRIYRKRNRRLNELDSTAECGKESGSRR